MRHRVKKFWTFRNFVGYLVTVSIFETVVESLFWLGGLRMLKGIGFLDNLLVNLPFWISWGIMFYLVASKFTFEPSFIMFLAGLTGILVEMPKTILAGWPLHTFILMAFINAVNYSFVVGFPFWLIGMKFSGSGKSLHRTLAGGVIAIVSAYIFVLVYLVTFLEWFRKTLYPESPMISPSWWAEFVTPNWTGFTVIIMLTITSLAYVYKRT
jgi:hypothetical protein